MESSSVASRVVESHFAGKVDQNEVFSWACKVSQASLVILGAGPPCQGVSGLNSERKEHYVIRGVAFSRKSRESTF